MRKQHFTLIEVLIGFSLASIALTTLLSLYFLIQSSDQHAAKQRAETFEKTLCLDHIEKLFAHIECDPKRPLFFTETFEQNPSLVFTTRRGTMIRPEFSGTVVTRLFLDAQNQLKIASYPLNPPQDNSRVAFVETLLKEVDNLSFHMLCPRSKPIDIENPVGFGLEKIDTPTGWQSHWSPNYFTIPPLIQIHITHKGLESSHTFYLPQNSFPLQSP